MADSNAIFICGTIHVYLQFYIEAMHSCVLSIICKQRMSLTNICTLHYQGKIDSLHVPRGL